MSDQPPAAISGVAALDAVLPALRRLAPSGFIFAQGMSFWGPDFYHSEYPRAWQVEYERHGYVHFDPILLWAMTNSGDRRWSDIRLIDLRGVLSRARRHGLVYGACLVRLIDGRRSILTASRGDREFTLTEVEVLAEHFETVLAGVGQTLSATLTPAEAQTLRALRDGLTHAEASAELGVGVPAIKARIRAAREKLGARTATQAVARAIQRRLI